MSTKGWLGKNERGVIILILLILSILPYFVPFIIPLPTYEWTTKAYQEVNKMKEGDLVLVSFDFDAGSYVETGNGLESIVQHLFNRGVKIVFVSFAVGGVGVPLIEKALKDLDLGDAQYGTDYINLGFVPGFETGMAAFASNPRTLTQDFYGTPIENLPIMNGVHAMTDFKLYVFGCMTSIEPWMRQFAGKLPIILVVDATGMALNIPYIQSGQLVSVIRGARGSAEYDALIGRVGPATKLNNAGSVTGVYAIVLIIAGNILYFQDRAKRREK